MKVSIIINTFNNESTIDKCLTNVVDQSYPDFECIIIDDNSSDKTGVIIEKYRNKDNRLTFLTNETNLGCSLTRRKGFEHSKGEYVVFIDGDDWMELDYLDMMIKKASMENADLVYCDYYEEDGKTVKYMPQDIDKKTRNQIIAAMASYDPLLVSSLWNKLIRCDLLQKVEFPEERYGEDMYISLQLAFYSNNSAYVAAPLYHYWKNNSGSLCNNVTNERERRLAMFDICRKILYFIDTHYINKVMLEPFFSIRMNKTSLRIFEDPVLKYERNPFVLYPSAIKFLFRKGVNFSIWLKVKYLLCTIRYNFFRGMRLVL